MLGIIARIPVQEGKVDAAIEAFKGLMVDVAKEEGTLMYTLFKDTADPNMLVLMDRYKDKAALDAHSGSDYFKAFAGKMPEFLAGKLDISVLQEVGSI